MNTGRRLGIAFAAAALAVVLFAGAYAQAQSIDNSFSGNVRWLEVWKNGNVAFTIDVANPPCGGQFLINISNGVDGAKNAYAALLGAKLSQRPVRIYVETCTTAAGVAFSYADVTYLYID
jgi:type 1 fimbria pilin